MAVNEYLTKLTHMRCVAAYKEWSMKRNAGHITQQIELLLDPEHELWNKKMLLEHFAPDHPVVSLLRERLRWARMACPPNCNRSYIRYKCVDDNNKARLLV
jgi:hypothetical protein